MKFLRWMGRSVSNFVAGLAALSMMAVGVGWATNYTLTQGAGTTFGSLVVAGVNYAQHLTCDPTTPANCGSIGTYGTAPGSVNAQNVNAFVTNANTNGAQNSANSSPVVIANDQACTNPTHAFKHITSATDTLAVQGVTSQTVRLCAWVSRAAGTATWFWENTASTNANCVSTLTQINGVATEAANTGEVVALPIGVTLNNTSGNGLCINSTGTGGVDIDYWYQQR